MIASAYRSWFRRFPPSLSEEELEALKVCSLYYYHLYPEEKKRFEHRLAVLLKWLSFQAHHLKEVNTEMRVVVGAGITQVCFGLRRYLFRRFRKIQIVPDSYTYPGMEDMRFIGDTNRNNWVISLSWPHVIKGFSDPYDAHNVVLHEVAHGLEWEHLIGRKTIRTFFQDDDYKTWRRIASKKLEIIQRGENKYLNDYGGINMEEMFAVSIEAFFEQPHDFRRRLPKLYKQMCTVLNQDPSMAKMPVLIPIGV